MMISNKKKIGLQGLFEIIKRCKAITLKVLFTSRPIAVFTFFICLSNTKI